MDVRIAAAACVWRAEGDYDYKWKTMESRAESARTLIAEAERSQLRKAVFIVFLTLR